jgi:transcriptional regulator of acetoin/glycerol metabolism
MQRAITAAQGNLTQAARKLGISRSTLHRRLGKDPL